MDIEINGYSVLDLQDGTKYSGMWQNNMFNGHGVLTKADGE